MDFFTAITIPDDSQPTNQEDGGTGNTTYCVIFAKDNGPADEEGGGTGDTTYCVALHASQKRHSAAKTIGTHLVLRMYKRLTKSNRLAGYTTDTTIHYSHLASSSPTMDSFTDVAAYLPIDNTPPTNEEDGGTGNTTYCVVFAREDLPANEESGGTGNTTYCVVA
ncbi:hypothetical protein FPV67DRAFT_1669568 [Lyophyllum atratum]|nr:hypothetical protein FPV67DRAFT_1669568 [Lyophyllum atratum]